MNILLIQIKRIGDLILTTPAITAVREKFPDAHISLIIAAGSCELMAAIGGIDRVLVAEGKIRDAADWFTVARKRYDYCLDFTRTDRSAFLTLLSAARKRITADHPRFRIQMRALSYNQLVDLPIGQMHTVDYHLGLLRPLGIREASPQIRLTIPESARTSAAAALSAAGVDGEFLLLHPGSARAEKFWEPDRWAAIIDLAAEHQFTCVVTGGTTALEQGHIAAIRRHSRRGFVDLSGKLDLLMLAAVIERARLLTTVDSAPVHLAAAVGTPQVALYGPTNPLHWRPRFSPAIVLQAGKPAPVTEFNPKDRAVPMNQISTEQVIDGMKALLAAPRGAL